MVPHFDQSQFYSAVSPDSDSLPFQFVLDKFDVDLRSGLASLAAHGSSHSRTLALKMKRKILFFAMSLDS
jgi:hypothetical protein